MSLQQAFETDAQGRTYPDVLAAAPETFVATLRFFDHPDRHIAMRDAAQAGRPPLAAVVADLEAIPAVDEFFRTTDAHATRRFRQAVGVIVRVIMNEHGWTTTGRKGYLGRRAKVPAGSTTPGAYYNVSGPSRWFTRAELYRQRPDAGPRETPPHAPEDRSRRLREGLDRLARVGTESERRETLALLERSLAETRAAEGRPF